MRSCELQIAISGVVTLNGGHYPHISSQPSAQVREVGWAAQMGPTDYRAERFRDLWGDYGHSCHPRHRFEPQETSLDNICWLSRHRSGSEAEIHPSLRARVMCQQCQPHTVTHAASEREEMITLWREKSFAWWHRVWGVWAGQILFIGVRRSHIWGDIGRGEGWCQHWLSIPTVMTRSYRERGYSDQ